MTELVSRTQGEVLRKLCGGLGAGGNHPVEVRNNELITDVVFKRAHGFAGTDVQRGKRLDGVIVQAHTAAPLIPTVYPSPLMRIGNASPSRGLRSVNSVP